MPRPTRTLPPHPRRAPPLRLPDPPSAAPRSAAPRPTTPGRARPAPPRPTLPTTCRNAARTSPPYALPPRPAPRPSPPRLTEEAMHDLVLRKLFEVAGSSKAAACNHSGHAPQVLDVMPQRRAMQDLAWTIGDGSRYGGSQRSELIEGGGSLRAGWRHGSARFRAVITVGLRRFSSDRRRCRRILTRLGVIRFWWSLCMLKRFMRPPVVGMRKNWDH